MDKETYRKEVKKIFATNTAIKGNTKLREKLDRAYELSKKLESGEIIKQQEAHTLVKEILETFFKTPFSDSFSIPINFIESPLGKMLFGLKFGIPEKAYTTAEITAIMGKTRSLISHDSKNGLVRSEKKGKNIIIYENDLIDYMISKGMSRTEAKKRISLYQQFKEQGYDLKDIKDKIELVILEEFRSNLRSGEYKV